MASYPSRPTHLDPGALGTREYWDNYYQNDLDADNSDDEIPEVPSDLESWFDDVNAPAKVLAYLTSNVFPLSPNHVSSKQVSPQILDLGTGNGSMLFSLRLEGRFNGRMVGVDYSQQSVDLARKLWKAYCTNQSESSAILTETDSMRFERVDLITDDPTQQAWWPDHGFDLVLDKGTFDAISLSSDTVTSADGKERRICESYPGKVARMVAPAGFLLITSCNWTEEELLHWFLDGEDVKGLLEVYGRIQYRVFEFGGRKGQGVCSVCFRRTA